MPTGPSVLNPPPCTTNKPAIPGRRRAEASIPTLAPEGSQRLREGTFSLEETIQRFGKHSTRETPRF
jgi:hypothetical protein